MFLSPLGERLGEGDNTKAVSCITPSPNLSPNGERSMTGGPEEFSLGWRQERQNYCRIAAIRLPVPLPA
jgi:hypothetical protein